MVMPSCFNAYSSLPKNTLDASLVWYSVLGDLLLYLVKALLAHLL